jgi:radical SAM enzyme (TIGR01210 family)
LAVYYTNHQNCLYINEKKLQYLKKILGKKEIEVAIGLESSGNFIRNVIINKKLSLKAFEKSVRIIKKAGATLFVYALVKPPFLTERESIKDAIKTIKYSFKLGKKLNLKTKVALEPVFIKPNTLVYELYKKRKYSHVWLWSIIEILKQTYKSGQIQIGLSSEGMKWNEMPKNCKRCTSKIIKLLNRYNAAQDVKIFENFNCKCKKSWEKEINRKVPPLRKRIDNYIDL